LLIFFVFFVLNLFMGSANATAKVPIMGTVVKPTDIEALQLTIQQKEAELAELGGRTNQEKQKTSQRRVSLGQELESLTAQLKLMRFKMENKTSYHAEAERAVLGVTSGLALPSQALTIMPTVKRIDKLIADYYCGQSARGWGRPKVAPKGSSYGLVDAGGMSSHPSDEHMLCDGHRNGFIAAVTAAFAHHYPLALRPQHFWLLVAQGVAVHVDLNAEQVRSQWVHHEGKKTLNVCCDDFTLGQANDWASTVSGKPDSFSVQIAANTVAGVAEVLTPPFSGTTGVEDIAQKIVVMDICKNYFDYKCSTCCGFPEITLEGTLEDWTLLREATQRLLERCAASFKTQWSASLLPLLDRLAAARAGEVDAAFWNSMCKRGGTTGSGARTWFNGWINVFFPYIDKRPNGYCVPYSPSSGYVLEGLEEKWYGMCEEREGCSGPDCEDFGSGMSSAPVTWNYLGKEMNLDFNAGFVGAVQDAKTLQIRPQISWFITCATEAEAS
jgi:hypothetical protein